MLGLEDLHALNAVAEASELATPYRPNLNVGFHKRLAYAYVFAPHTPEDASVKASYDALRLQTLDQYTSLVRQGVKVELTDSEYPSALAMFADIASGRLCVYTGGTLPIDHPMAEAFGYLTLNSMFRAVHDYYGHYGGLGEIKYPFGTLAYRLGGDGLFNEERAFQRHKRMYTPEAYNALACETRAQTACNNLLEVAGGFVDQKAVLLPEWCYE